MRPTALAFLLFAAGCTPMQWTRPDSPPAQQIDADLQHCQAAAWSEVGLHYRAFAASGPWMYRDPFGRRFGYPYGPFADPFDQRYMEESRLTDFCMRAKGYDLAPAPRS